MSNKKLKIILLTIFLSQLLVFLQNYSDLKHLSATYAAELDTKVKKAIIYNTLPGYGKKCWIGEDYYFIYKFDKPPKMGTTILKVQLFDKKGKKSTDLNVIGSYGMPSMKGAHDSGDQHFKLNKKGDYLLPVNVVMPGEWEVKLTFIKDKKVIYQNKFRFNV